jgi:SnoaL-like domain
MNDRIHELLHSNIQEVFGEGDAMRRRAAIDELYTEDCVLYVPPGTFVGREALDKFAGDLRATHPHFASANRRLSTMPAVWPGAPAHAAKRPNTPAWM